MSFFYDPEHRMANTIIRILKMVNWPLSILCYVGALAWFVMLGHRDYNVQTYFSDKCISIGNVKNGFRYSDYICKKVYDEYMKANEETSEKTMDEDFQMPVSWLVEKMTQLQLEVYTQNFSLEYPLNKEVYHGTNVYGILRSPRAASLEALVLTAPHRPVGMLRKDTAAGIAVMLAFAQYARSQIYWGKDIIFLVTQHEQLGMQAWLEAYHSIPDNVNTFHASLGSFWKPGIPALDPTNWGIPLNCKKYLKAEKLTGRSGSIHTAINLEIHTPNIKYIEIKLASMNGHLPNLDLTGAVYKACAAAGIKHSFKNSFSWIRNLTANEQWSTGVRTMLRQVIAQIAGVPRSNHGLFHHYGIQALTLEGHDESDPENFAPEARALRPADFHRLGTAVENIMRILNDLTEKFHHGYFFYIMAATNRFISMAWYMPSLCLLCTAMFIRALYTLQDADKNKSSRPLKSKTSDVNILGEDKPKDVTDVNEIENTVRKRQVESKSDENHPAECKESQDIKDKWESSLEKGKSRTGENSDIGNKESIENMNEPDLNVGSIAANYFLVHFLAYTVTYSPLLLCQIGEIYELHPEISVYFGLLIISEMLNIVVPFIPHLLFKKRITYKEMCLINVMLVIELAAVCLAVGMQNFPLGLAIGVIYTPMVLFIRVVFRRDGDTGLKRRSVGMYLKSTFCLLLHPFTVVSLPMMLYSDMLFPDLSWTDAILRGKDAAMQAITFAVYDSMIHGDWTFDVAVRVILPIWLLFWQILHNGAEKKEPERLSQ